MNHFFLFSYGPELGIDGSLFFLMPGLDGLSIALEPLETGGKCLYFLFHGVLFFLIVLDNDISLLFHFTQHLLQFALQAFLLFVSSPCY